MLDGETRGNGKTHGNLPRGAVHGVDIREVDHSGFVAKMLEGNVGEVEMHTLKEHIGCDQNIGLGITRHGAVVAHTCYGGFIYRFYSCRQTVDKTELAD